MAKNELSRRKFIGTTTAGLVGAAVTSGASSMSAVSYNRIIGANDRINLGFLGCGGRSSDHQRMVKTSEKDKNLGVVAVCDIWKNNMEKAAANCKRLFETLITKDEKPSGLRVTENPSRIPSGALTAIPLGNVN